MFILKNNLKGKGGVVEFTYSKTKCIPIYDVEKYKYMDYPFDKSDKPTILCKIEPDHNVMIVINEFSNKRLYRNYEIYLNSEDYVKSLRMGVRDIIDNVNIERIFDKDLIFKSKNLDAAIDEINTYFEDRGYPYKARIFYIDDIPYIE